MLSRVKIRFWCFALLTAMIAAAGAVQAPAESWKQIIVRCSPQDLDLIRSQVSSAIVDGIPGYYLLTVPGSTDVTRIEGIHGKGSIQASENAAVSIHHNSKPSSTPGGSTPSLGNSINYYGTPARQGYVNQSAAGQISLNKALGLATG